MREFYSTNKSYYSTIDYASAGWVEDIINLEMVSRLEGADRILEVGCGSANILRSYPRLIPHYCGCDLSSSLVSECAGRYPAARFQALNDPLKLPFADNSFEAVFPSL
jgi:ubiquinone/menaquinone biosynthesis C-methylase UbiE